MHIGGGGVYDATGNAEGFLDEVAIFDKAIPAERVREHYLLGLRVCQPPELRLGDYFASDEPDGAGSVVDGAAGIRGTTVWNNVEGAEAAEELIFRSMELQQPVASGFLVSPNTCRCGRGEENNFT